MFRFYTWNTRSRHVSSGNRTYFNLSNTNHFFKNVTLFLASALGYGWCSQVKKKRTDLSSLPIRLETEHIWLKKDSQLLPWAAAVLSPLPCNSHSPCTAAAQAAPAGAAGSTSHHRGLQTSEPAWATWCWKHGWAGKKEAFHGKDKPFCSLLPKLGSCKFLAGWALALFCARQGYSGIRPGIDQVFRGWLGKHLVLLKTLFACFSGHLNVIKNFIRKHNHRKNKNNSSLWGGKRCSYSGLLSKS